MDAAIERAHVAPLLRIVDSIARGEVEDGSLARAQLSAATWRLVRLRPTVYCEPAQRHELSGPDGGPVRTDVRTVVLQAADLLAMAREPEGTE